MLILGRKMIDNDDIAMRLRAARKVMGFTTAKAFVTTHGIPKTTYSQHERGDRKISATMLKKYAKLLKVNYEWLATGEGLPMRTRFDETRAKLFGRETLNLEKTIKAPPLISEKLLSTILQNLIANHKKIDPAKLAQAVTSIYSDVVRIKGSLNDQLKAIEPVVSTFLKYAK